MSARGSNQSLVMDNFALTVVGAWNDSAKDDLLPVLQIALNHDRSAVAWAEDDGALVLYWSLNSATPFVAALDDARKLHAVVVGWLAMQVAPREIAGGDADEEQGAFEAQTISDAYALLSIRPKTRWIGK